jgi:hypothetical protein
MVAINTTSIAGLSTSIGIANGRIDDNDNDISSLNSNKQNKIKTIRLMLFLEIL